MCGVKILSLGITADGKGHFGNHFESGITTIHEITITRVERSFYGSNLTGTIVLDVCIQLNNGRIDNFVYGGIDIRNFVADRRGIDSRIDIRCPYNFVIIFTIRATTNTKLCKCSRNRGTAAFTGSGCTVYILA